MRRIEIIMDSDNRERPLSERAKTRSWKGNFRIVFRRFLKLSGYQDLSICSAKLPRYRFLR